MAPFAIYLGLDEPNQAEAGDCMAGQTVSELRTVDCADSGAQWTVLARLEGKTEADHNDAACAAHPETEASFFEDGRRFRKGFILCLGPVGERPGAKVRRPTAGPRFGLAVCEQSAWAKCVIAPAYEIATSMSGPSEPRPIGSIGAGCACEHSVNCPRLFGRCIMG
ncbi:hypothetical protein [Plantactinospora sp. KLBMP9567]|uniref:LppU/SCO3897 family protein n=1 Tax=Plantactinospora sp. KLBMP9567 TaxID=3085900 RepID=UPI002981C58E|nr:hypothetical protein [Plantactinospora sp. KLBMP9567]MDW5326487.1 hypothetical protein [Plantactinospora sp. KLBMP9567]